MAPDFEGGLSFKREYLVIDSEVEVVVNVVCEWKAVGTVRR